MKEEDISINQQPCIHPITTVYGVFMAFFFPNEDSLQVMDTVSNCFFTVDVADTHKMHSFLGYTKSFLFGLGFLSVAKNV